MHDELVSYAQNLEDLVLYVLLHKKKKGFYVDVGANHETFHSVTKFFYNRGWHGINIEPTKSLIDEYKVRTRDTNLHTAVSNKPGELAFREYPQHDGLSTFATTIKKQHTKEELPYHDRKVKVTTLRHIFSEQKVKDIDFLKIDVEGHEPQVLQGNDWKKYRPRVVVFEGTVAEKCRNFLEEQNYHQVYFDGLNYYMVADEQTDLDMSQYPALLLSYGYYTSSHKSLKEEHQKLQSLYAEIQASYQLVCAKLEEVPSVKKSLRLTAKSLRRSLGRRTKLLIRKMTVSPSHAEGEEMNE
ncbi:MAG TPA: FkbM family methyltransferase [Candidatus Saccharimonadales bacterium]|nr:FkbM family methyltransferase [Candidatus Saccharimonadales bacterium]